MDSIQDLLKNKKSSEPPQLKALREYVKSNHQTDVQVGLSSSGYSMIVPDATLATILRMEMPKLQAACNLDKKLYIRIGYF